MLLYSGCNKMLPMKSQLQGRNSQKKKKIAGTEAYINHGNGPPNFLIFYKYISVCIYICIDFSNHIIILYYIYNKS